MSRPGYSNALRAILEGQPALARPILEVLEVTASALKNKESDFSGADSLVGLEIITGGGVRLSQSATGEYVDNVSTFVENAARSIILDNRPTRFRSITAETAWKDDRDKPIFRGEAVIDLVAGVGEAVTVSAQLFLVGIIDERSLPNTGTYQLISKSAAITVPAVNGTVEFIFDPLNLGNIRSGTLGPLFRPFDGSPSFNQPDPITIMWVWGTQDDGSPATIGKWEADGDNQKVDPGGSTQLIRSFEFSFSGGNYIADFATRNGVPGFSLFGAEYITASIEWTTNPLDLGQAPGADTELKLQLLTVTPSDTAINAEIKEAGGGAYQFFANDDLIGVDNTPTGGFDLSSLTRVQAYDIRVKLTPSSNLAVTPQLIRVGLAEVTSTIVDGEIDVETFDAACDPITCDAEVATASIVIRRDGVKDYRSFAEELFSENNFSGITMRILIGHDQIARGDWLAVDTFKIRNMDPSGDGLAVDLVSSLFDMLAAFPPEGSRTSPDLYTFAATDIGGAWQEIHDTLAIPTDLVGDGPPAGAPIEQRVIADIRQAIDLRTELDFISGGVTISRQGVFEFRDLFDDTPPDPDLAIELSEYEVLGWDDGTDRRIPEVQIIFPEPGSAQFTEKSYSAPFEVVDAFGTLGGGQPTVFQGSIMEWVPRLPFNEAIGDAVGERLVDNFSTGLLQLRIRARTPRPNIEIGDVLNLDQDRLVTRDPFTGEAIRGRSAVSARVTGVHDVMGTELTLWLLPPFLGTPQQGAGTSVAATDQKTALVRWAGEDFRPSRWAADYAAETGAGGNIQKVLARWERFTGRLACESNADGQAPRCVLPLRLTEFVVLREMKMAASIPVGTLDVELVRYPIDGSPREVIETFTFTDTVGRDLQETTLSPFHTTDEESTYTVEVTCPLLDDGDTFEIYAFGLKITEAF